MIKEICSAANTENTHVTWAVHFEPYYYLKLFCMNEC